jgi:quercetin dioxygenase-like cupin family protein
MEYKRNEATLNRPEGDRVLDAPYVYMDLDKYIDQLKDEETWERYDRNGITIFKTDYLTTVLTCLHKGAAIKDNTVDGLFQVLVIEGKVRVTTQEGDIEMRENEMITLHPNIFHNIEALKKSTLLLQTVNGKTNGEQIQHS